MEPMPVVLQWNDVLVRIALALLAGALIGFNRSESGKTAGLRTTILVCLAACMSMLQVNALLLQAGKPEGAFSVLDLMRLPLGILTGMGFIGGGAILHRDGLVSGVTTAATLWFVTVIGLCIGGGQLSLGALGAVLALFVVWPLRMVERRMRSVRSALVTIGYERGSTARGLLTARLREAGFTCRARGFCETAAHAVREEELFVQWREPANTDVMLPQLIRILESAGLASVRCSPEN
ncbi:magnesium transporter MgtC [Burkholderia territorii]|uniref:Protein MgtC n=1 Tax=Burkholderia territorii TaxID=1503055 RepID=A0A104NW00_9BURK|nr:MgtC/SapB family protein [Burkholderia territorii]KUZ38213.1 magnesium transporter MgtC [Burkholderia territorii]KUZ59296.1 magnesium transporter MgtC [Burkholderia territorii]KVL44083.1 magnesium transporter MgtC [Burkholderia territorii]KVN44438.1 magnesium transporter MgtC [Burkholderia territorii]KVQ59391.1 magnesium transporter MgtC [Burkholderia territorii]